MLPSSVRSASDHSLPVSASRRSATDWLIDIGDSAAQPMRRVNGEVCGAVELLVASDMVEFPTIGERLAGPDLEPDNSHLDPSPSTRWTSLSSIRGWCSPIGGEQKQGP